ncbi:MAG TPA: cytidylate kinase-like family protein, partial [Dehalococcoidia bacterium]|nr:cytidylate kinase-like family protein [Dehalococcoidia bacterium]
RTMGAGGEQVALQVALDLGYRYVDDEIVIGAARAAGVSPEAIEGIEHADLGPLMRELERLAGPARGSERREFAAGSVEPYGRLVQRVIEDVANQGRAVIVAHGAGLHLVGRLDTLRVLITGSVEGRAGRLADRGQMPPDEARRAVLEADGQRNAFLKRFYGIEREAPERYDMVVNTDIVMLPWAARAIAEVVRAS